MESRKKRILLLKKRKERTPLISKIREKDKNISLKNIYSTEELEKELLKRTPLGIFITPSFPNPEKLLSFLPAYSIPVIFLGEAPSSLKEKYPFIEEIDPSKEEEVEKALATLGGSSSYTEKFPISIFEIEKKEKFHLPSSVGILSPFVNALVNFLQKRYYISSQEAFSIRVALYELLMNALEHGNLEISFQEKRKVLDSGQSYNKFLQERMRDPRFSSRKILFQYKVLGDRIEFIIKDEGKGFPVKKYLKRREKVSSLTPSGKGLYLVERLMDKICFNKKGNVVKVVKFLKEKKA